ARADGYSYLSHDGRYVLAQNASGGIFTPRWSGGCSHDDAQAEAEPALRYRCLDALAAARCSHGGAEPLPAARSPLAGRSGREPAAAARTGLPRQTLSQN